MSGLVTVTRRERRIARRRAVMREAVGPPPMARGLKKTTMTPAAFRPAALQRKKQGYLP
jgi:hypothetical protein